VAASAGTDQTPSKPERSLRLRALWPELMALVRPRRGLLAAGLVLIAVNRVCGLVLPASTKFLIDDVIGARRADLLLPLVGAVVAATLVQGITSFGLTQILSKAAQRLIADLRRQVQAHVGRLPVAYFDANKTGALVSRIMTDVEGVRNLIGTGLVDFVGGVLTALLSLITPLAAVIPFVDPGARDEAKRAAAQCAELAARSNVATVSPSQKQVPKKRP